MKRQNKKTQSTRVPAIIEGKIMWAKVHKPEDYFGTSMYSADIIIDSTNKEKILGLLDQALAKNEVVDPSKPLILHKNKDGQEILKLSRRGEHGPITVLNGRGDPMTDLIGNGSDVAVIAYVGVAESKDGRSIVPSVRFTTVKVLNLVQYGGSLVDQLSKITGKNEDPLMDADHGF